MRGGKVPAADGLASLLQDGCGQLLQPDHGADLLLDRQAGEFMASALFAREQLVQIAVFHRS